jgi:hypothetical protein
MGNVYKDFRDDKVHGLMDEMHNRLKNPGGAGTPVGGNDHTKPALDYAGGSSAIPTARIKGVNESVKQLPFPRVP